MLWVHGHFGDPVTQSFCRPVNAWAAHLFRGVKDGGRQAGM